MPDSWEWVQQRGKQQRRRQIYRWIVYLAIGIWLILSLDVPRRWFPAKHDVPPVPQKPLATDKPHDNSKRPLTDRSLAAASAEKQEQADVHTGNSIPASPIPSNESLPALPQGNDPALLAKAQQLVKSLQARIAVLQAEEAFGSYDSTQWQHLLWLTEQAASVDTPQEKHDYATRAGQLLKDEEPMIYLADFHRKAQADESVKTIIAAALDFHSQYPKHEKLAEIEGVLGSIETDRWLALAKQSLSEASPDDAGLCEGWLPIAGAWQLVGEDAEARDAIRQSRAAIPRMTSVQRAIESAIDLCQHDNFDAEMSELLIEEAAALCAQVSNPWQRGAFYSNLSGLANTYDHRTLAMDLLEQSTALLDGTKNSKVRQRAILVQKCRAAAWTDPPEQLFAMTQAMERLGYQRNNKLSFANGYLHTAMAAARHADQPAFLRAMFQAETILASVDHQSSPNYLYLEHAAAANIERRRWRAATIIANNIPDPNLRLRLLCRVLSSAPQDVYIADLQNTLAKNGSSRWAITGVAAFTEHQLRLGEPIVPLLDWIRQLPLASQRAAAMAGIARAKASPTVTEDAEPFEGIIELDLSSPTALVRKAQRIAESADDPIRSAFATLQIAHTWHRLGHRQRYRDAVATIHDRCFQTWKEMWERRPAATPSFDGSYYYKSSGRHRKQEQQSVDRIIACLRHLSELQADIGDSSRAMESCLYLANAAGFRAENSTHLNPNFLHLEAIANRLSDQTGVGSEAFTPAHDEAKAFARSVIAAWSDDLPGLKQEIENLRNSKSMNRTKTWQIARGYGELAILYAERSNLNAYRDARRRAVSEIEAGRAPQEIQLLLAYADVIAGELALAESSLTSGSVAWFGDASRPRSRLAAALAQQGRWEDAAKQAQRIPVQYPAYRGDAWEAVARYRRAVEPSQQTLSKWLDSFTREPDIQVGILCGLALAAEDVQSK